MKVVLSGIKHSFGDTLVLQNIDFTIEDGEVFSLLGPSGCGKTTILKILAGFIKPTEGRVFLGEEDYSKGQSFVRPEQKWKKRSIYRKSLT